MKLTDRLKFPFPEEEDTGAVGLYLETLARQAEAALGQYEDEVNGFLGAWTTVNVTSVTDTVSAGFEYDIPFGGGNPFRNTGPTVVYTNFKPEWLTANTVGLPTPGWWAIGATKITTTMSTVTDNAPYSIILEASSWDIEPGVNKAFYRVERNYYESNTGGDHGDIHGIVYVPPGVEADVDLKMYHLHTGGVTRNLAAGIVTYRTFLGLGDVNGRAGL